MGQQTRFPARSLQQLLLPARLDQLLLRRGVRAGKRPPAAPALRRAAAVRRSQWVEGGGPESWSSVKFLTQTTAAASLDSGSDSALTASDSSLISA
jgi:hypothetical protein